MEYSSHQTIGAGALFTLLDFIAQKSAKDVGKHSFSYVIGFNSDFLTGIRQINF